MEWMENLSDELKVNDGLKKFDSVDALAKSYVNIEAMQGNSIRMAGPDASDEDRAIIYTKVLKRMPELVLRPDPDNAEQTREFHAMLGVPEDINGYVWEGEGLDENIVAELKALALETNMSKAQFKTYVNKMAEMQGLTHQQAEDSRTRMGAELKTEWGMAFEDRYAVVERFLADNPDLGSIGELSPDRMKAYYNLSRSLTGVKQMHAQPVAVNRMTPMEAQAQIRELDNNPVRFSQDPSDRFEQKKISAKRIELMREAYPEKYA